jgi:hypothetical protein
MESLMARALDQSGAKASLAPKNALDPRHPAAVGRVVVIVTHQV